MHHASQQQRAAEDPQPGGRQSAEFEQSEQQQRERRMLDEISVHADLACEQRVAPIPQADPMAMAMARNACQQHEHQQRMQ